ncbi:MAG: carboxypeptidase regulatory-like domain-containing protein [Clostridia bacterium]|nr:carboxypeptidase regulatory-like domain-containing protein [Clostridia bacterium]
MKSKLRILLVMLVVMLSTFCLLAVGCSQSEKSIKIKDVTLDKHGMLVWMVDGEIASEIKPGSTVDFIVYPDEGYTVESVMINDEDVIYDVVDNKFSIANVKENLNVSVEYSYKRYNINTNTPENGTISIEGNTFHGETAIIKVTPDFGYKIKTLIVNGRNVLDQLDNNVYRFEIYSNSSVFCEFEGIKYMFSANTPENGNVEVSKSEFLVGEEVTITAKPDAHYRVDNITLNGQEITLVDNQYTFTANGNAEVVCSFKKIDYTITKAPTENGSMELSATIANYGDKVTVTVTPNENYEIKSVTVNGKEVELVDNKYEITVDGNVEIVCEFEKVTYQVSVLSAHNGSAVADKETPEHQDTVIVTFTPDTGYELATVTVNGQDVLSSVVDNVYTFVATENVSVECTFTKKVLTVQYSTPTNGSIVVDNKSPYYGESVTITFVPNTNYQLSTVKVNNKIITVVDNKLVYESLTENLVISATFVMQKTKFTGYVKDGDGNPVANATVTSGSSSVYTSSDGSFTFERTYGTYTVTAKKTGYYDKSLTGTASGSSYDLGTIVIYEKKVGVDISSTISSSKGRNYATISFDETTKSEKIVTTAGFNNYPLYLKDMCVTNGVVFFSVTNRTNTTGSYEADPGIGIYLQSASSTNYLLAHVNNSKSRYLKNGDWSNVVGGNSSSLYNVATIGQKYYFAFVKSGDSVKFYAKTSTGSYSQVSSYSNSSFAGNCYFGFTTSVGAFQNCTIEFNDISYIPNSTDVNANEQKYSVTVTQPTNGHISVSKSSAGASDTVTVTFTPNTGYVLSSARINGNKITVYNNVYTINGVSENLAITAEFVIEKDVTITSYGDGTISYAKDDLHIGNTLEFRATPNTGKRLTALSVNGVSTSFKYTVYGDYVFSCTISESEIVINATFENGTETTVAYSDGSNGGNHNYDASLFYRNDKDIEGADPGAIYVSEEDDPVYGGWFYMAVTGYDWQKKGDGGSYGAFPMYRSKNLSDWEQCGAVDGYALKVETSNWSKASYWAPELLQETITVNGVKKNRYYIYFSASNKLTSGTSSDKWDGLNISIGVSDCPYGPYTMVDTSTYYQFYGETTTVNKNNETINGSTPVFNFYKNNSELREAYSNHGITKAVWPAIDISPFIDPATGDMYCYFSQQASSVSQGNIIWVVKMKDYITPDYTTMHAIAKPGYNITTTDLKPYVATDFDTSKAETFNYDTNGKINEGGFTIAHYDEVNKQWLYYLTYSPFGYGARAYSVTQAISTSPNGPFIKIDPKEGFTVIGITTTTPTNKAPNYNMSYDFSEAIDYTACSGHHSFVKAGNELFAVFHAYPNSIDNYDQNNTIMERRVAVDRVKFVTSPYVTLGDVSDTSGTYIPVLYGNGPSYSYQPLPEVSSGYENVADEATITHTNTSATGEKYLCDGLFVTHSEYKNWEYQTSNSDVLTFEFDSAKNVRAVMVYNSAQYAYALKSVRKLTLTLDNGQIVTFNNLSQDAGNYSTAKRIIRYGSSIIADFEEMSVKKIEITVNSSDKLDTSNSTIRIGDVVILARADGADKKGFEFRSASDSATAEYIVDGVANDKVWMNKKWYEWDSGEYQVKATADLGEDGMFVTATVYDKYMYHAGNRGEYGTYGENGKYEGLNRWYKNTWLKMYAYVGDASTYSSDKLKDVTVSAFSVKSSHGISADMSVDGVVNSGNSRSFTIEAYVPYELFGITNPTEAYLAFDYQRPLNATNKAPNVYSVGKVDRNNIYSIIKVDKSGFVSGGYEIKNC